MKRAKTKPRKSISPLAFNRLYFRRGLLVCLSTIFLNLLLAGCSEKIESKNKPESNQKYKNVDTTTPINEDATVMVEASPQDEPLNSERGPFKNGESADLIITTELDEYPSNVEKIIVTIENPTEWEDGYGEWFILERFINDKWELIPHNLENGFSEIYFLLPPNSKQSEEINIKDFYKLPLNPGTYRISKERNISQEVLTTYSSNEFLIKK